MGFFNNIGKAISDASQSTIQKGKEVANIAKDSSLINDEKRKINDLYTKIGEQYALNHREDPEPAFAGFINDIIQAEKNIAALQEEINKLKGLTICPNCGTGVSSNALFCPTCGLKIERPAAPEPYSYEPQMIEHIYCNNCGCEIENGSKFCTTCGTPVQPVQSTPIIVADTENADNNFDGSNEI